MKALTLAFVGETVAKERTGSAMGLLGSMSAVGTALGPTLGGVLIAWLGWRAMFLVNLPLGLVAIVLAYRVLPADRPRVGADPGRFDGTGTLLLAVPLAAYAMATTAGRGFGAVNIALLLVAGAGAGLFIRAETRATSPLVRLAMFRNPVLRAGFVTSSLVTTVVMATLVVGPFYLSGALGLDAAGIGLVMSSGPIVAALAGVPAGRFVDRLGASGMSIGGLLAMLIGTALLPIAAPDLGVAGYVAPLAVITAGYAIFQAANNTAVLAEIRPDERGAVSGMLTLSRNLGLVTGASAMGAIYAAASGAADVAGAGPEATVTGMQVAFAVAALLVLGALVLAVWSRAVAIAAARAAFA